MRIALLLCLIAATVTASIEKHVHYHFESMDAQTKRELQTIVTERHRGWWGKFKCYVKFMFNSDKRRVCLDQAVADDNAKKGLLTANATVQAKPAGRRLNYRVYTGRE